MLSSIDKNLKLGDKILINLIFQNHENISIEPILKIKPPIK
jgi:copper(I)-binding protein